MAGEASGEGAVVEVAFGRQAVDCPADNDWGELSVGELGFDLGYGAGPAGEEAVGGIKGFSKRLGCGIGHATRW